MERKEMGNGIGTREIVEKEIEMEVDHEGWD